MTQRLRLLLVHPRPDALGLLRSMLAVTGHQLVEAVSDCHALRRLRERPDLAVLGVDPHDPDALELLAYIRRHYPDTPVVLLFATSDALRHEEALGMGAAAVLGFPPNPGELRQTIHTAVEQATTRQVARIVRSVIGAPSYERPEETVEVEAPQPVAEVGQAEPSRPAGVQLRPLKEALEEPERGIILRALEAHGWNRIATARALDINRTTLFKKMRKYGLKQH